LYSLRGGHEPRYVLQSEQRHQDHFKGDEQGSGAEVQVSLFVDREGAPRYRGEYLNGQFARPAGSRSMLYS